MNTTKINFFQRGIVCLTILLIMFLFIISNSKAEEATSSFLHIYADARGTAMGGALGTITGDVYSIYWNPAGLSKVLFKEIGATYHRIFQGMNYSFIGYATPSDYYGTIAGQIFFLGSGPITATYENLDGSFAGTGGSFSVNDLGMGISQAKAITNNVSYGISLKLISHRIMNESAFALAGDIGFIYQPLVEELKFGAVLQNFSTTYKFLNHKVREPWSIRAGTSYAFSEVPLYLAIDYNFIAGNRDSINIGSEFWVFDIMAIRTGVKLPSPSGFLSCINIGLGLSFFDLYKLDYSFSPDTRLGITHKFSLLVNF